MKKILFVVLALQSGCLVIVKDPFDLKNDNNVVETPRTVKHERKRRTNKIDSVSVKQRIDADNAATERLLNLTQKKG